MKNVFTRCRVPFRGFCVFLCPFYLEYRRTAVSEVSKGKKWSVNPFQTLMCRKWNTHTVIWSLGIMKKKWFGLLKNKICTRLFYVDVQKRTLVKLDLFPCLARDQKSPQRRMVANIFSKEVELHCWGVCSTNSVFIVRSQKIYSRAFIWVIAQHFIAKGSNVNTSLHKVVYKKENLVPR